MGLLFIRPAEAHCGASCSAQACRGEPLHVYARRGRGVLRPAGCVRRDRGARAQPTAFYTLVGEGAVRAKAKREAQAAPHRTHRTVDHELVR